MECDCKHCLPRKNMRQWLNDIPGGWLTIITLIAFAAGMWGLWLWWNVAEKVVNTGVRG